ncbi:GTPase HflX [Sulfolobus acidocaldarius SUSAZ]|nr:GTPase HflX [Sulfolobus acidocaldarius SUSAZ]
MNFAVLFTAEEYEDEAKALAEAALYNVLKVIKLPKKPNPNFYISQTKLLELKNNSDVDTIIIFETLKSRHFINLIRELKNKKILDKILLLLEIFALHAGSKEAKLQIELARLKHQLPVLKDMYKRMKVSEQQGPLGAGVYGIESTVRLYQRRIVKIKEELNNIKKIKEDQIRKTELKTTAIVGYTNAGKTTLFNALTGLKQKTDSSMFTTTLPKRYGISVNGDKLLLVDTVGFIRGIPPQIIEAFYVTLSEAKYADSLLLVVDSSVEDTLFIDMILSSFKILRDIGISGKPMIIVLNKADLVNNSYINQKIDITWKIAKDLYTPIYDIIPISALKGYNINTVRDRLLELVLK